MNPQDSDVNGEIADNPIASPAATIPPEESSDVNPQGASTTNPEEVAWNSLKGPTQNRVKQILAEQNRLKAENDRLAAYAQYASAPQYQQPVPQGPLPEVRDAVQKLAEVGIATDAKVDAKITQRMGDLIYNMEMQRLEGKFDGDDGLPKFDRQEFQDFVQKNPKYQGYDPEDVYKFHMYGEEIADVAKTKAGNGQSTTSSLRPTKTVVREEQWTPDWIENRMKQSDGLQWYAKNKDKVNTYLQSTFSKE